VSAAAAPRLTSGIVASVLLHGGLIAAFILLRPPPAPPAPPMIRIHMVAGPAGERQIGVVQDAAPPVVEPPKPVAATTPPPQPKAAKPVAKPKPKPTPKAATQTATKASETKPQPQPTAGGGPTGGKGSAIANVDTPGIEFDYPGYTNNIVSQLIRFFGNFTGSLEAEVRFTIRRDGSVDPNTIHIVTSSGNYTFDQRALGAVEAAANAKVFGTLPGGFREDILPVTFRFSPRIIR